MVEAATDHINILIVDDHDLVRTGMRLLIESRAGLAVVAEAASRGDALALAAHHQPDVVLLDLDLGEASGLDLLPDLLDCAPSARVIVVTGVRGQDAAQRAVLLGAVGVVNKGQAAEVLIQAIERVHAGEIWLEPALVARVLAVRAQKRAAEQSQGSPEAAKIARLTAREREVISLIGQGLYNKQIATRLSISEATVSHHLTSIFDKLGLANRFDLVVYAYRNGLAKPG
jgi:two-component system, NarL family, nitrate/nitrite response regulator NarL